MKTLFNIVTTAILIMGTIMGASSSRAENLDLSAYQDASGAISLHKGGVFLDPYFSTKSLLAAYYSGLDIQAPAKAWIQWMIRHQRQDGLFDRFCMDAAGEWLQCMRADADDALLANWLELLYLMAPPEGLPSSWQSSSQLAWWRLSRLYDTKLGVYHISDELPVALFMDNVEIYSAMRSINLEQKRLGARSNSHTSAKLATDLKRNILRVFRPAGSGPFLVSTQYDPQWRFYPEQVAQLYPLLYELSTGKDAYRDYTAWMSAYGSGWLNLQTDFYPWGLVALTAIKMGDRPTAHCWVERAAILRYSERWNVLEEAVFQAILNDPPSLSCP